MANSTSQRELGDLLARLVQIDDTVTAHVRSQIDSLRRPGTRKELEKLLARRERQRERMVDALERLGAGVRSAQDAVASRSPLEASMLGSAGLALEAALLRRVRRLAEEADDRDLVKLARRRRKDSEQLLASAQDQVRRAVSAIDGAAGPALDAALSLLTGQDGGGSSTTTARPAPSRPTTARRATPRRTTPKRTTPRRGAAKRSTPKRSTATPTETAKSSGRAPLANYDKLSAPDVLKRLKDATPAQARRVATYERANKSRKTILERADRKAKPKPKSRAH